MSSWKHIPEALTNSMSYMHPNFNGFPIRRRKSKTFFSPYRLHEFLFFFWCNLPHLFFLRRDIVLWNYAQRRWIFSRHADLVSRPPFFEDETRPTPTTSVGCRDTIEGPLQQSSRWSLQRKIKEWREISTCRCCCYTAARSQVNEDQPRRTPSFRWTAVLSLMTGHSWQCTAHKPTRALDVTYIFYYCSVY